MRPKRELKELQFNLRMSPTEFTRLTQIAEYYGTSLTDTIRLLLKAEERRLVLEQPQWLCVERSAD